MGDNAILVILMSYLAFGLVLAAVKVLGEPVMRRIQAQRIAGIVGAPAGAADAAAVMRQVDAAIQSVELELRDLSAAPETSRGAREGRVIEDLAYLDSLFGQLRSLPSSFPASYTPAIAKLHTLAAKNGVRWTPPRA